MKFVKAIGICLAVQACTGAIGVAVSSAAPATTPATPPAAAPATRPALGTIDLRDYCTILLAPKLMDYLQCTDDQRATFQELNTKMHAYLDNAAGNIHGPQISPGLIAARGETALGMIAPTVRDALTPEQDAKFVALFDDGTLHPIKVGGLLERGRNMVTMQVTLDYSHYAGGHANSNAGGNANGNAMAAAPAPAKPATPPGKSKTADKSPTTSLGAAMARIPHPDESRSVNVTAAVKSLKSQAVAAQVRAATDLYNAVPTDDQRQAVLDSLKPHLTEEEPNRRFTFVRAYCQWATAADMDTLKSIVALPADSGDLKIQDTWAEVCTTMVKLDPKAAAAAITSRAKNFFFRQDTILHLTPLTEIDGPISPLAQHFIDQLQMPAYHDDAPIVAKP